MLGNNDISQETKSRLKSNPSPSPVSLPRFILHSTRASLALFHGSSGRKPTSNIAAAVPLCFFVPFKMFDAARMVFENEAAQLRQRV